MKVDIVKIRVDDNLGTTPKMAPEIYQRRHRRGAQARPARRGASVLSRRRQGACSTPAPTSSPTASATPTSTPTVIAMLKARNVCVCPTLMREVSTFVYESTPAFFSDPLFLKYADPQTDRQRSRSRPRQAADARAARPRSATRSRSKSPNRNLKKLSRRRRHDRDGHRHRPAGALPGLLRADGARDDGARPG